MDVKCYTVQPRESSQQISAVTVVAIVVCNFVGKQGSFGHKHLRKLQLSFDRFETNKGDRAGWRWYRVWKGRGLQH